MLDVRWIVILRRSNIFRTVLHDDLTVTRTRRIVICRIRPIGVLGVQTVTGRSIRIFSHRVSPTKTSHLDSSLIGTVRH